MGIDQMIEALQHIKEKNPENVICCTQRPHYCDSKYGPVGKVDLIEIPLKHDMNGKDVWTNTKLIVINTND